MVQYLLGGVGAAVAEDGKDRAVPADGAQAAAVVRVEQAGGVEHAAGAAAKAAFLKMAPTAAAAASAWGPNLALKRQEGPVHTAPHGVAVAVCAVRQPAPYLGFTHAALFLGGSDRMALHAEAPQHRGPPLK